MAGGPAGKRPRDRAAGAMREANHRNRMVNNALSLWRRHLLRIRPPLLVIFRR